jgi:hypothetical protein
MEVIRSEIEFIDLQGNVVIDLTLDEAEEQNEEDVEWTDVAPEVDYYDLFSTIRTEEDVVADPKEDLSGVELIDLTCLEDDVSSQEDSCEEEDDMLMEYVSDVKYDRSYFGTMLLQSLMLHYRYYDSVPLWYRNHWQFYLKYHREDFE